MGGVSWEEHRGRSTAGGVPWEEYRGRSTAGGVPWKESFGRNPSGMRFLGLILLRKSSKATGTSI